MSAPRDEAAGEKIGPSSPPPLGRSAGQRAGSADGSSGWDQATAGRAHLVADAERVLSAWPAPSLGQERLREHYLAFFAAHPLQAASRDLRPGHLTASVLLLDHHRRRVLLTLHPLAGQWYQLGGHVESADGSLRAAAAREATEESGIGGLSVSTTPIGLDRHPTRCRDSAGRIGTSSHLDVEYVAVAPAGAQHRRSRESLDLAWFDLDALPEGADDVVRGLVDRVRRLGLT